MMLKINKPFRNCSAVTHIWRTKVGGSLCFLLCRLQKMFTKLATIKQFWKKKNVQENLNFPFYLLDLYLKLFQPTLLSLFTSGLQYQLTSNQVYLCPIGKSRAVCSKWNSLSPTCSSIASSLCECHSPSAPSSSFCVWRGSPHSLSFSPVLGVDPRYSLFDPHYSLFPVVSIHRKPSPLTQIPAVLILGPSCPVHFLHCSQFDISKIPIWLYLQPFSSYHLLLAILTSLDLFRNIFLFQNMPMLVFEEMNIISLCFIVSHSPVLLCIFWVSIYLSFLLGKALTFSQPQLRTLARCCHKGVYLRLPQHSSYCFANAF